MTPVSRFAALLSILMFTGGCDAVSDVVDGAACSATGYADSGTVSATVGGSRYSTPCVRVEVESGVLTIASIDDVVSDNDQRLLAVTAPNEVGTFEVGETTAGGVYTVRAADTSQQAEQTFASTSGRVTVTSVTDTSAEGTFSFVGQVPSGDQIDIVNGSFDVTF
ncbi:hypothetical protein [Rubrivirga sp.]|uniref:hypothetical protein n=1 Tax=Rubrivirga sp. TaxID=1885344 RepID=UPI003C70CD4B